MITGMDDNELTLLRRSTSASCSSSTTCCRCSRPRRTSSCRSRSPGEASTTRGSRELTTKVGLADRLRHRPAELSGGQQQRVAVARSLIARPTVVFADEPTGNLDTKSSAEILALLREMSVAYGQTIVMVTHDPRAAAIADRILYLLDGTRRARPARRERGGDPEDDERARHGSRRRDPCLDQGPARAQAPALPDLARDRDGRRDGERHLRPHRHDQRRLPRDLRRRLRERRRDRHRKGRLRRHRGRAARSRPRRCRGSRSSPASPRPRAASRPPCSSSAPTAR